MKRYVYLIRHGLPLFENGIKCCIGSQTDLPLSNTGIAQVRNLKGCFPNVNTIYCSNLQRSYQSALEIVNGNQRIEKMDSLNELNMGEFEGKTFEQIKKDYPYIYKQRGCDWSVNPDKAESLEEGEDRLSKTIRILLEKSNEDLVLVIHDGLIRSLIYKLERLNPKVDAMPRVDYGSISVLSIDEESWKLVSIGKQANAVPSKQEIETIFTDCQTPSQVINHSCEVKKVCRELYESLNAKCLLNKDLLFAGALLHDVMRHYGPMHPLLGRDELYHRGYIQLGIMIEKHHEIDVFAKVDEAMILHYADKLVQGTNRVTLQQRFEISVKKCCSKESIEKHKERYLQALCIEEKIVSLCKGRI